MPAEGTLVPDYADVSTTQPTAPAQFDAELEGALLAANIPVLLMVLVHLTGDLRWLEARYQPSRQVGVDDNDDGGLSSAIQNDVRSAAADAIRAWHNGRPPAIELPDEALLLRMLGIAMGEEIPAEYAPMLAADLASAADIESRPIGAPDGFKAIIVGAGVSGLCAAVAFERAGVPYEIYEASDQIGGVWHENRYPGAGVDTPSHLYSF